MRLTPEINVTPLVDVVLVLLIIFMVIAPQLEAGEHVELPSAQNVAAKSEVDALTLTLTADGRWLLDREALPDDGLLARLRAAHEQQPDKRLVLKADRGAKYMHVRRMFEVVQTIGLRGVAFTVDSPERPGG